MKFNKQIVFFIFLVCLCFLSYGSNQKNLDALIEQFKLSSDNDSIKDLILEEIDDVLDTLDKDTILVIWSSLIEYCEENAYYKCLGFCNYKLGYNLNTWGDYLESFKSYEKSLKNYKKNNDLFGIARVHNGLGILFKNLNKYDLSFWHYSESARIFNDLNETVHEGRVYLNMGGMFEKQDSLDLAIKYLQKAKKILEEFNDRNKLSCYINLGIVFKKEKKYDSAYYYFNKSYNLSFENWDIKDKFYSLYHLGEYLFRQDSITGSELRLTEAQQIAENPNTNNFIAIYDKAKFSELLGEYFAVKGDSAKAYLHLLKSGKYDAKNKRDQSNIELSRLKFERFEKDSQVKRKRRDLIIAFTFAGLLLSLLLIFSLYRSYKHKKKANQLLTEMDELKTRLYSNITHELRTPLTLILGPLEQMLSSEAHEKPTWKQVKMMRKNANTLLNLINQMLDLSKIEAKNIKLVLVEEDINKFLRTRFSAFASLTEQKSISYQYSLLKEKNIKIFDPEKIEKIINNLVSNAIKFTPRNGKISCYVNFPRQDILELIIEDSGKGIPKNELSNIFDRFHQVNHGERSNSMGTGIGLALTKELVELLHGNIEVESELDKGSIFRVKVPLGTEHLDTDEFQLVKNHDQGNFTNLKTDEFNASDEDYVNNKGTIAEADNLPHILVVEDHLDIREFIVENLKDCFSLEQAENGKTGLQKAIEAIPDLVITDVIMPEMGGIELCENLKTDERTSHIPVIILTGKSSTDDRLKGLEIGADAYLTKPFNIKELKLRVQKLIEQRQKLRKQFTHNLNLEPKDIVVTSADEKFILRAMEIIEKNISNADFEINQFQEEMYMSRMQLFRKIKALTNQTPSEFIRTIRLKRAANLLDQNFGNIAQITFEVGFNNPSYFAKCFKELYGQLPSEYLKNKG